MTDDNMTRKIIEPILRRALEPMGLAELELSSSVDHDGDPIILVIAKYRPGARSFSRESIWMRWSTRWPNSLDTATSASSTSGISFPTANLR